jgi:hypothetical protein
MPPAQAELGINQGILVSRDETVPATSRITALLLTSD